MLITMGFQRKTSGNFEEFGKLPIRSRTFALNSLSTGPLPSNDITKPKPLLHVLDEVSNAYFLVDTGTQVSPYQKELSKTSSLYLVTANGSRIKSYGTCRMELRINQDKYIWLFQVADVYKPIIGADFLRAHNLLVNLKNKRLLRADNLIVIRGVIREVPVGLCNIMSLADDNEFATLLKNRPELTTPTFTLEAPKHGVQFTPKPKGSDQRNYW